MINPTDDRHIDYGVDAPSIVATLCGIGFGGLLLGGLSGVFAPMDWASWLGWLIAVLSLAPATLGLMMVAYALGGKRRFRDWMIARHSWRGDELVLDIGAGRGLATIAAAQQLTTGRVLAIDVWRAEDLSKNSAAALRANVIAARVETRVAIETMDARHLTLADGSVDVILSVLCMHNIEPEAERAKALVEVVRVLKPGGVAYLADYTGTKDYAEALDSHGLEVIGPINAIPVALSLMFLVEVRKPEDWRPVH
jgi:arsenite methyltransferase